ncbi:MAG: hypothetical protein JXR76_11960 [Deltaproteobacteria bacterium]|nr:hypothetical protein [Deltaproteobacteria bacterium]
MTTPQRHIKKGHKTTGPNALFTLACFCALMIVGVACVPSPDCDDRYIPDDALPNMTVMSYNIGNSDTSDARYSLRIKKIAYERHIAKKIAQFEPDVIALQEVLSPKACAAFSEKNPENTCSEAQPAARRILGPDYSIVCDERHHIECVGVHKRFGKIRGVAPGEFVMDGARTMPLPMAPCQYGDCKSDEDTCDDESTVSHVVVDTARGPIRIVHTHPTAIGVRCLQAQVQQTFRLAANADIPSILLGDWNFDPARTTDVVASSIWNSYMGGVHRFEDHSPLDDMCRPASTQRYGARSLDRVVTNFARGECFIVKSSELDADFEYPQKVARVDHNAVICDLNDPR